MKQYKHKLKDIKAIEIENEQSYKVVTPEGNIVYADRFFVENSNDWERIPDILKMEVKFINNLASGAYVELGDEGEYCIIKNPTSQMIEIIKAVSEGKERIFTQTDIQQLQHRIHFITGDGEVMQEFNKLLGVQAT